MLVCVLYSGAQSICAIMLALNLIDFKVAAKQRKQKTNSGKNEERSEGRGERKEKGEKCEEEEESGSCMEGEVLIKQ